MPLPNLAVLINGDGRRARPFERKELEEMIQATTNRPARSRILVSGFVLAALTATRMMVAKRAHAADFMVTNTNDSTMLAGTNRPMSTP